MKIGLLLSTYNDLCFINDCLKSWIELAREYNISIAITHGMFKEYYEVGTKDEDNQYIDKLKRLKIDNKIDYLYVQNEIDSEIKIYQNEAELRNWGLKYLLEQNIDYFWTIGVDEIYKKEEIIAILDDIKQNNLFSYYKINYKNFVFDKFHYINGFCPPRIWSNKIHGGIDKFYWDDDIIYKNGTDYKSLSCRIIPKNKAFVNHYTWLSDKRSFDKVNYQKLHFSGGAGCSFSWDDENNKLIWNQEFFKKTGQETPKVFKINE